MFKEKARSAGGFSVGDVLRISCAPENAQVVGVTDYYAMLRWPWVEIDRESTRVRWNGSSAFPRDPDHFEWRNTPWRVDPAVQDLREGDVCIVGIPPVEVRILDVRRHEPPAEMGWLPRPDMTLGVVLLGDEGDPEAGFSLHMPAREPIVIEHVDGR